MEKKAPEMQTLLANADLWKLMLGHFKNMQVSLCQLCDVLAQHHKEGARCKNVRAVSGRCICGLGWELDPHTAQSHPQSGEVSSSIHTQSLEAKQ